MHNISNLINDQLWQYLLEMNSTPWEIFVSLLDIFIVAILIYRMMQFVQGTRLMILVRGVFLFIIVNIVAEFLGLVTLTWLLNQFITYWVIALIIIFQPEIRQALERLGHSTKFIPSIKSKTSMDDHINDYLKAFEHMSKRKIGALLAIERTQTLEEYISSGIKIDADISSELLINIFIPNTPLHDGAVIVQGDKIAATSTYLPLTERTDISKEYGTRHRAAIGLAQASDALVLIVSEETGGISVAHQGALYSELTVEQFKQVLSAELSTLTGEEPSGLSTLFTKWERSKK